MRTLFLLFFLSPLTLFPQSFPLGDSAKISVITCGPYQAELYSAFGHSAFRVYDPASGFDAAYNYGVFDFDQPNFYLNFARGYLYYMLGVYDYRRFEYHYISDNRFVHEQVLNLSQSQKQKIFDFLQNNARPENASYRYDYFYNNCATKMRDVVKEVLGDSVTFDGSYITTDYTIRDLTDLYIRKQQPWGDLGIDICLGLPMDKKASASEYMFLPDYVESGFDHAFINRNGSQLPLVKQKNIIYEAQPEEKKASLPHPLFFLVPLALLAAVLSWSDLKRKKLSVWFDAILFGISGAVGMLLLFLWLFTDHQAAARNMNLLWAFPGNLVAIIAALRSPAWLRQYFGFLTILLAATLLFWFALPQDLHYALIPVAIALLLRSFTNYRLRK